MNPRRLRRPAQANGTPMTHPDANKATGGMPLFATSKSLPVGGLSVRHANEVIDGINAVIPVGGARVHGFATFSDLPQAVQQATQQAGITPNQFRGVTMPKGQVYIVHDKHSSQAWVQLKVMF